MTEYKPMSAELRKLLKAAEKSTMSDAECYQQRISFAYGNVKMSNDKITRKMVEEAAQKVDNKLTTD